MALSSQPRVDSAKAASPVPAKLPTRPIALGGAGIRGNPDASVVIVEFSDFQCPYCGVFARTVLPALEKQYIQPGRVLLAFRQYPLQAIHPFAANAAAAAVCAGIDGRFWELHDRLFQQQGRLQSDAVRSVAAAVGVDLARFDECLGSQGPRQVKSDLAEAQELGMSGTPSFLLGYQERPGVVSVTAMFSGSRDVTAFQAELDRLLAGTGSGSATGR
jgi:protein-disulfide isomerase